VEDTIGIGRRSWKPVEALAARRTSLADLRRGINLARILSDPRTYLEGHRRSHPSAPLSVASAPD